MPAETNSSGSGGPPLEPKKTVSYPTVSEILPNTVAGAGQYEFRHPTSEESEQVKRVMAILRAFESLNWN